MKMKLLLMLLPLLLANMTAVNVASAQADATPTDLRKLAGDYYNWRNQQYPVSSSDAGRHNWDDMLTDYGLSALLARRLHVKEVLAKVRPMQTEKWSRDDRIDWLPVRAKREGIVIFVRVRDFDE